MIRNIKGHIEQLLTLNKVVHWINDLAALLQNLLGIRKLYCAREYYQLFYSGIGTVAYALGNEPSLSPK